VFRERHLRLDRDPVLSAAHEGLPGRDRGLARAPPAGPRGPPAAGANRDMTPPPRCRLTVAPRFHLAPDWAAPPAVGTGGREADGRFFPRGPGRSPAADELPLLVAGPEDGPEKDAAAGCLFQIPGHLRAAWWDLLDRSVEAGDAALPGFEDFTRQVA